MHDAGGMYSRGYRLKVGGLPPEVGRFGSCWIRWFDGGVVSRCLWRWSDIYFFETGSVVGGLSLHWGNRLKVVCAATGSGRVRKLSERVG